MRMRINERLTVVHVRAVVALHRTQSFTQAAAYLGVSQSSLSRTVSEVERLMKTRLFRRTTRSVTPTVAAGSIVQVMQEMVTNYDSGIAHLERCVTGSAGTVTIGCLPSIAATVLPPVIQRFARDRPQVKIEVRDGLLSEVIHAVEVGDVDFGIAPLTSGSSQLRFRKLGSDEFYCAVPAEHRFSTRTEVHWAELDGESFIAFSPSSSISRPVEAALEAAKAIPGSTSVGHNVAAVAGLVSAGLGMTAVPGLVRPLMGFAQLSFIPLRPAVERQMCAVERSEGQLSLASEHFLNELVRAYDVTQIPHT